MERASSEMVLSLALIPHLVIGNNLPLQKLANFFHEICQWLVIEFIPKDDSQVKRLLASREDIFPDYNQQEFERIFSQYFSIAECQEIVGTKRTLYLMRASEASGVL